MMMMMMMTTTVVMTVTKYDDNDGLWIELSRVTMIIKRCNDHNDRKSEI